MGFQKVWNYLCGDYDVETVDGTSGKIQVIKVDSGTITIPSGAATEAKQDDGITQLTTIAGDTTSLDGKVTACDTTNLATAANQLPDGHNVTVDNAAGASAVNIQDGGNSITIDGIVTSVPATVSSVSTETQTSVGTSTTSLLSSNANRKFAWIQNQGSTTVWVSLSGTAVVNQCSFITQNGVFTVPAEYTGAVSGIVGSGSQNVTVVEG